VLRLWKEKKNIIIKRAERWYIKESGVLSRENFSFFFFTVNQWGMLICMNVCDKRQGDGGSVFLLCVTPVPQRTEWKEASPGVNATRELERKRKKGKRKKMPEVKKNMLFNHGCRSPSPSSGLTGKK